jgi:hypothetical protein
VTRAKRAGKKNAGEETLSGDASGWLRYLSLSMSRLPVFGS